jgi:hypothetical protein
MWAAKFYSLETVELLLGHKRVDWNLRIIMVRRHYSKSGKTDGKSLIAEGVWCCCRDADGGK